MVTVANKSSVITLERSAVSDLDFILAAEADGDTSKFIIPWTGDRHLHALSDPDCAHLIIREPETTERLGFVMLFGLASCNRDIEFRRIVSIRKNQGIGRAALQAVKGFAFHTLNAHRLWLDVKSKNARARHLYASERFLMEGIMRECLLEENGFESLVLMSILRSEFEASVVS